MSSPSPTSTSPLPNGLMKPRSGPGSRTGTKGPDGHTRVDYMGVDHTANARVTLTTVDMGEYDLLRAGKAEYEAAKAQHEELKANYSRLVASPGGLGDRLKVLELEETLEAERAEHAGEVERMGKVLRKLGLDLEYVRGGGGLGGVLAYWEEWLPKNEGGNGVAVPAPVPAAVAVGATGGARGAGEVSAGEPAALGQGGDVASSTPGVKDGRRKPRKVAMAYYKKQAATLPVYQGSDVAIAHGEEDGRGNVELEDSPEECPVSNVRGE